MPSQVLSRTPEASLKGRPLASVRVPGAWLAMHSRAPAPAWMTGRGSCASGAPKRGWSRQMRQARSPAMTGASASSDIEGEPVMRREIAPRFDLGERVEHLRAHMRQHDAPGVEAGAVCVDLLEAEMGDRGAREPVA